MNRWALAGVGAAAAGTGAILAAFLAARRREEEVDPAPPIVIEPISDAAPIPVQIDENEIEALARVIASEARGGTEGEQLAIAWTARNRFHRKGRSIYAGQYPWRAQLGSNPPFSSARPAEERHRQIARRVLGAPWSEDVTAGATSFFEPRMQDVFFQAGEMMRRGQTGKRVIDGVPISDITRFKDYKKDAAAVRKKWSKGSTLYATAGRFEFWGSAPLFAKRGGVVQTIAGLYLIGAEIIGSGNGA